MKFPHVVIEIGFALGLLANALLFIPQIIAILKNKSAKDVSLITFLGFNVIQIFTFFHGLILHDYLLALGYLLSIMSCGAVSILIIYFDYILPREM
jgi:MtN3 and saliva related transmembrane protein